MHKSIDKIADKIKHCEKCNRAQTRQHVVPGEGEARRGIVLLGEAPGKNEDKTGRPFVGRAGKYLDKIFDEYNINRHDFFITSILKCFHPNAIQKEQLKTCKPWSEEQIRIIRPKKIVIMGKSALKGFLEIDRPLSDVHETDWQGTPCQITSHPAAAMRFPKHDKRFKKTFSILFKDM